MIKVRLTWGRVENQWDQSLGWNRVVYALYDSNSRIYYIGKADDQTLRERLKDPDKARLVLKLQDAGRQPAGVLYGIINADGVVAPASYIVSAVEALLIKEENPWCNTDKPNISQDLTISCSFGWLGKHNSYTYVRQRYVRMPAAPVPTVKPSLNRRMGLTPPSIGLSGSNRIPPVPDWAPSPRRMGPVADAARKRSFKDILAEIPGTLEYERGQALRRLLDSIK